MLFKVVKCRALSLCKKAVLLMTASVSFLLELAVKRFYHGKHNLCCIVCISGLRDQIIITLNRFPSYRIAFSCETVEVGHPEIWA